MNRDHRAYSPANPGFTGLESSPVGSGRGEHGIFGRSSLVVPRLADHWKDLGRQPLPEPLGLRLPTAQYERVEAGLVSRCRGLHSAKGLDRNDPLVVVRPR
jgi:hypothetical protein